MGYRRGWVGWLVMSIVLGGAPAGFCQPLTSKTVNIESPLTTPRGRLDFPFTHRFSVFGAKVTSSPTFTLSTGLTDRASLAIRYATSSDVNTRRPGAFNEWEPMVKLHGLQQATGAPLDVTGLLAYNTAAGSTDAGLVVARRWGAVTLLGTAKAFSNGFGQGPGSALGGGLRWELTRYLQVSADLNGVTSGGLAGSVPAAWSVGTSFEIPYSPHSVSLYVTNANTHTLEGTSHGSSQLRGGFEFLIPFSDWRRWGAIVAPPVAPAGTQGGGGGQATSAVTAAEETTVAIQGMKYLPAAILVATGSVVRWENRDSMIHTVTSSDGQWDSGEIRPGQTWSKRFDEPGTYRYYCTPHPFMTGTVVVR